MGLVAEVIGIEGGQLKVNLGGDDLLTVQYLEGLGSDQPPLVGDFVALLEIVATGQYVAVGALAQLPSRTAAAGEIRSYARGASGGVVSEVIQQSNGSVVLSNSAGTLTLETNGDVTATGKIVSAVAVEAPSIVANGKELVGHDHNILSGSSAPGPTGVNN